MTIEELKKHTDQEASWLQYYGSSNERKVDLYNDTNFYDRIVNAGYAEPSKRFIPLSMRCASGFVTSKNPVLESTIEELEFVFEQRNHEKNIYTSLEYFLATNCEGSEKIKEFIRS
jgi:hypothetical protein